MKGSQKAGAGYGQPGDWQEFIPDIWPAAHKGSWLLQRCPKTGFPFGFPDTARLDSAVLLPNLPKTSRHNAEKYLYSIGGPRIFAEFWVT